MRKTIGNKIAMYRQKVKWTQAKLAQYMGVSSACVAMWESGKRTPRPEQLNKLSIILNCPIDLLFGKSYADIVSLSAKQEELIKLIEQLEDDQVEKLLNVIYMINNPRK